MTTSLPRAQSTSQLRARDWCYRIDDQEQKPHQTAQELATLRCPFKLTPETDHCIPGEFSLGTGFYRNSTEPDSVPWTGYYAIFFAIRIAVFNAYGVWFEIQLRNGEYTAIRRARAALGLKDWPVEGLDLMALTQSGEPLSIITREPRQERSVSVHSSQHEEDPPQEGPTEPLSSRTARGRRGGGRRRPRGNGDDPFTVDDLEDDSPPKKNK